MRDTRAAGVTAVPRLCRGCGEPLSRYNSGHSCRGCVVSTTSPQRAPSHQGQDIHPLRRLRLRRGMTLATLAGFSGLSEPHLSRIENGHRKLDRLSHIMALAAALRVRPVELVPWVLQDPE